MIIKIEIIILLESGQFSSKKSIPSLSPIPD